MLESLFNKVAGLGQVFSCEISEIFKNTSFYRTPPVAASGRLIVPRSIFFPFVPSNEPFCDPTLDKWNIRQVELSFGSLGRSTYWESQLYLAVTVKYSVSEYSKL